MTSSEIRTRFLEFFKKRGHAIIPSSSLVTTDEKGVTNSTLFNTAGMQPLIPYLLGKAHPEGTRLVDVQKCIRTVDIDDIGDKTHATFFEMLGNWSLGDYFKDEAIEWSYEFLTSKEEGLGLDPKRLYITVFEGDENASRDDESAKIWQSVFDKSGIEGERIFYMGASMNWWEAGDNGPCGPDTEMYYDVKGKFSGKGITREEFIKADESRDVVEIWNDVFMQYEKKDGKIVGRLEKPSVDTGAGLERLAMVMQDADSIYETDLLNPIVSLMKNPDQSLKNKRIIADHLRASVFLISDGVIPSNTGRGYVLRRLLRRAVVSTTDKNLGPERISVFVDVLIKIYENFYPEIAEKELFIKETINTEISKFTKTLAEGLKAFEKGTDPFVLFSTYGFPIELTLEIAKEKGIEIDVEKFRQELKKHQELSRAGAEQKFKGGLADTDQMSVKYHTATHLLHQALHDVLGDGVEQKGSNITSERLRFDFSYPTKMTDEQKGEVEEIVNKKIKESLPVKSITMSKIKAEKTGARHFFGDKYGDEVSVYYVGDSLESAYSKEFCGGPHVDNTSELGIFKIKKEESVASGVRRIKAVLV